MRNAVQPGEVTDFTNDTGSDIAAGDPVAFGNKVGVASVNIPDTATGTLAVLGVYRLPKVSAGAIGHGAKVYLTSGGNISGTASGNTEAGWAFAAAADGDTEILVKLPG